MLNCPNCHKPMESRTEEAFGAVVQPLEIASCPGCNLFWFDNGGSIRLTPKGVLGLFQYIGQVKPAPATLVSSQACPRCTGMLAFTHDQQRNTRFTYWRCVRDNGQLMTFNQFLAEKNFIRPPSAAELAKLRETVRQITCSQCGAPIDLSTDAACTHCGAPVALIDSEGVAKALRELSSGAGASVAQASMEVTPQTMSGALGDAQLDALFNQERIREREQNHDLLAIGVAAIGAVMGDWLLP
jgi:hypothetical protein